MYVVKKAEADEVRYGQKNDWKVIYTSESKEAAQSVYKQEFRILLEANPNYDKGDIERRLQYCVGRHYRRSEVWEGCTGLAIYLSKSEKLYEKPQRPDRTELLDKILGS